MTDTYKNGPGNVSRLPDRVVDCLIDTAGVSRCAPGRSPITVRDQTAEVERLVHDTCEELLARLPALPDEDGERWRFMTAAAMDLEGPRARLIDLCFERISDNDPRPHPEQLREAVDQARAMYAAGELP